MKSAYLLGCLLLVSTITPSRPQKENSMTAATTDRTFFRLGDNLITISKLSHPRERSFVLVSLHNDEETSLSAAQEFVETQGGQMISLENNAEHDLQFEFLSKEYRVDPNKIFTQRGRAKGLKSGPYKNQLAIEMQRFADYLLEIIPHNKHVIGVHNYHDEKRSIKTFKTRKLVRKLRSVHRNSSMDENDFIITTNEGIYRQLSAKGFNVVLQHSAVIRDDGSLSIAIEKTRRHYVDIVVQTGHREEQKRMLGAVAEILDR
jgi:hypothetical protein